MAHLDLSVHAVERYREAMKSGDTDQAVAIYNGLVLRVGIKAAQAVMVSVAAWLDWERRQALGYSWVRSDDRWHHLCRDGMIVDGGWYVTVTLGVASAYGCESSPLGTGSLDEAKAMVIEAHKAHLAEVGDVED